MIEIRLAQPSDAVALAELRWDFRAGGAATAEAHDAFVARCAAWMRQELASGASWRAWVAEEIEGPPEAGHHKIVGQVWLHTIHKVPNPIAERERHAYLSNLYVMPEARGGVGTRLLEAALVQADADGVDSIVLWPSARSRSLYLRRGFIAHGAVLELPSTRS
jgi:ribosomal protein S18 acetylase RimI-like enzyme